MKKWVLLLIVLWAGVALATTFHTLPFNGNNVFATDEQFATSTDTYTAYCTWDNQFLYLAYTGPHLGEANDTTRNSSTIYWYIDTDPHADNPKSGLGTDKAGTVWTQIMNQEPWWFDEQSWELPFYADFFAKSQYSNADSAYVNWGHWNANDSLWEVHQQDTSFANLNLDQQYYEIKVPWDTLQSPSKIYILGYLVSTEWKSDLYWNPDPQRDVGGTYGSWPAQSLEGGDGDKGPDGKFNHWFAFEITSGVSPTLANDPPVVSDIPGQSISQGGAFATIDLNAYVFDDLTPDTLMSWSVSGNTNLTVTIGDSNQATVTVNNPDWTGSDTLTFTATDQGGKTDSDTAIFTVNGPSALSGDGSGMPAHFRLKQNYPNPFNPVTSVSYHVAHTAQVKITVYNALGQEVAELVNARQQPGRYQVTFNAADLASGMYTYRMSTSTGFVQMKKMILIK